MADKDLLFVHRLVGGLLTLSSDYGFVLEDDEGICGYALGTVDVKPFVKKCKLSWIPFMQEKYHKPDCEKDLSEAEVDLHLTSNWSSPVVEIGFVMPVCCHYRRWCWVSMKRRRVFPTLSCPTFPPSSRWTFMPRSLTPVWPKAWWDVSCLLLRQTVGVSCLIVVTAFFTDASRLVQLVVRVSGRPHKDTFFFYWHHCFPLISRVPWCIL